MNIARQLERALAEGAPYLILDGKVVDTDRWAARRPGPPPRDSAPGQWFVFKPWVYDVDAAIRLLRAAPRPPQPLPVQPWHARTA